MNLTKTTYVDEAERVIKSMIKKDRNGNDTIGITTSKIRNLLSMISEIYNDALHNEEEKLSEDMISRIQYLKMRFAYEAGREATVKEFVQKAGIFEAINKIGNNKEKLIIFCHYMEALVAYRKFYIEKDD